MIEEEKIFFNPGDIVKIKHDIDNIPEMYVVEKVVRSVIDKNGNKDNIFIGIKCRWFDNNKVLREAIFSTKDIKHI